MNRARMFQSVSDEWVSRGYDFGRALVAHYAEGGSPQSRARSGDRGTESNPVRLAQSKIGECAAALYFGLDPARAAGRPGHPGADKRKRMGIRLSRASRIRCARPSWHDPRDAKNQSARHFRAPRPGSQNPNDSREATEICYR
jgi:hypothetical protein